MLFFGLMYDKVKQFSRKRLAKLVIIRKKLVTAVSFTAKCEPLFLLCSYARVGKRPPYDKSSQLSIIWKGGDFVNKKYFYCGRIQSVKVELMGNIYLDVKIMKQKNRRQSNATKNTGTWSMDPSSCLGVKHDVISYNDVTASVCLFVGV